MRLNLNTMISEARSNPEKNEKKFIADLLAPYKDDPDIYITYTAVDKIGLNPNNRYNTPLGIYCYPIKETYRLFVDDEIPYASDRDNVWVLRKKPGIKFLDDMQEYSSKDFDDDIEKLIKIVPDVKMDDFVTEAKDSARVKSPFGIFWQIIRLLSTTEAERINKRSHSLEEANNNKHHMGSTPNAKKWMTTTSLDDNSKISVTPMSLWNSYFRKLGYYGVADKHGQGIIHSSEPTQAVFFSTKGFDVVDKFLNYKMKGLHTTPIKHLSPRMRHQRLEHKLNRGILLEPQELQYATPEQKDRYLDITENHAENELYELPWEYAQSFSSRQLERYVNIIVKNGSAIYVPELFKLIPHEQILEYLNSVHYSDGVLPGSILNLVPQPIFEVYINSRIAGDSISKSFIRYLNPDELDGDKRKYIANTMGNAGISSASRFIPYMDSEIKNKFVDTLVSDGFGYKLLGSMDTIKILSKEQQIGIANKKDVFSDMSATTLNALDPEAAAIIISKCSGYIYDLESLNPKYLSQVINMSMDRKIRIAPMLYSHMSDDQIIRYVNWLIDTSALSICRLYNDFPSEKRDLIISAELDRLGYNTFDVFRNYANDEQQLQTLNWTKANPDNGYWYELKDYLNVARPEVVKKFYAMHSDVSLKPEEPAVTPVNFKQQESVSNTEFDDMFPEAVFTSADLDMDKMYELFSADYLQQTGKTWTKDKFISRASAWLFYGRPDGAIAIRKQSSGYVKLVGAAGSMRGKYQGIHELMAQNLPVWGFVSGNIAGMSQKVGFIVPQPYLVKLLLKFIDKSVFGDTPFIVNNDGSITITYHDVGEATKYFIGTKAYFSKLLVDSGSRLPNMVMNIIKGLIHK